MTTSLLVIDDDPSVRKAFKFALEDSPYTVDVAASGEEGIVQLNSKEYRLIFLDLKMPGMNGAETLRKIREINRKIPVYIVTAFHKEFLVDLQQMTQEGFRFELLRKPIGADEIVMIVNNVLAEPESH